MGNIPRAFYGLIKIHPAGGACGVDFNGARGMLLKAITVIFSVYYLLFLLSELQIQCDFLLDKIKFEVRKSK